MNPGAVEEVGKQVGSFMDIMRQQPLSLALVIMNFLIVAYLFYAGAQQLEQRAAAMQMIVDWSKETDKLLGGCVTIDVTKLILENMQRITDTMLQSEKQQIERMQRAIDREREINQMLQGRPSPPPVAPPIPPPPPLQGDPPKPTPQSDAPRHILFTMPP